MFYFPVFRIPMKLDIYEDAHTCTYCQGRRKDGADDTKLFAGNEKNVH